MSMIRIHGAKARNLKNISLDIPRYKLVTLTGLSGSGKTSLAIDTLYLEAHRKYIQSFPNYAKQVLMLSEKSQVDSIEGLSPAISLTESTNHYTSRSTVGTITEIHDYIRLLYAKIGISFCPIHNAPLQVHSISEISNLLLTVSTETKIAVLAPILGNSEITPNISQKLSMLLALGYMRVRINKSFFEIEKLNPLRFSGKNNNNVEVVVDRLRPCSENKQRLLESLEKAASLGNGHIIVASLDSSLEKFFSTKYICTFCNYQAPKLEPRFFSKNNPIGACEKCYGLGESYSFCAKSLIINPDLSFFDGALYCFNKQRYLNKEIMPLFSHYQVNPTTPFRDLPPAMREEIFFGSIKNETLLNPISQNLDLSSKESNKFSGVIPILEKLWNDQLSFHMRRELKKYRTISFCSLCKGSGLSRIANQTFLIDKNYDHSESGPTIHELESLKISDCLSWIKKNIKLNSLTEKIAEPIIFEIDKRLQFLEKIGLGYLSLNRNAKTISSGEMQRLRLARQISSGLSGIIYVLDEPSSGLHQRDKLYLINLLKKLRDLGNTVVVVEHDEDMIHASDWIIDLGPGSGDKGGYIVAQGILDKIKSNKQSITGHYLSSTKYIPIPKRRPINQDTHWISLKGATGNNLQSVNLHIPIGRLTCITGVSGSGKSTLIIDTLAEAVSEYLKLGSKKSMPYLCLEGVKHFNRIKNISTTDIAKTLRSNPATYMKIFPSIRELFSSMLESRSRGYQASRFSLNVAGGRCETCQGLGFRKTEMYFLPDMYLACESCNGKRFNHETLEILYRGKNISEVLDLTIEESSEHFNSVRAIRNKLEPLMELGLSYIKLGQNLQTLSQGEIQRIKISQELSKPGVERILYILDEPSKGLHPQDIKLLNSTLNKLISLGNTVLIIEHNLHIIKTADWIVDMGPEGGEKGGKIIAEGTPEAVANSRESLTGKYLSDMLEST